MIGCGINNMKRGQKMSEETDKRVVHTKEKPTTAPPLNQKNTLEEFLIEELEREKDMLVKTQGSKIRTIRGMGITVTMVVGINQRGRMRLYINSAGEQQDFWLEGNRLNKVGR